MAHAASGSEHKSLGKGFVLVSGLISAVSIGAFSMSCAYVCGFQSREDIDIISHFLPIDYIAVSPQWIVPAAPALLVLFLIFLPGLGFVLRNPPETNAWQRSTLILPFPQEITVSRRLIRIRQRLFVWLLIISFVCAAVFLFILQWMESLQPQQRDPFYYFYSLKLNPVPLLQLLLPFEVIRSLLCFVLTVLLCFVYLGGAHFFMLSRLNPKAGVKRTWQDFVINKFRWQDFAITKGRVRLILASVFLGLLVFAYRLGFWYGPFALERSPQLIVSVQSTALTQTQFVGKLLFVLTHATLFLDGNKVISVPNERIVSIQTQGSENPKSASNSMPSGNAAASPNPMSTPDLLPPSDTLAPETPLPAFKLGSPFCSPASVAPTSRPTIDAPQTTPSSRSKSF